MIELLLLIAAIGSVASVAVSLVARRRSIRQSADHERRLREVENDVESAHVRLDYVSPLTEQVTQIIKNAVEHHSHGKPRTGADKEPEHPSCECTGTFLQEDCAAAGCLHCLSTPEPNAP